MVWLCLQWQWLLFWLGWLCRSGSAGESDGKIAGVRNGSRRPKRVIEAGFRLRVISSYQIWDRYAVSIAVQVFQQPQRFFSQQLRSSRTERAALHFVTPLSIAGPNPHVPGGPVAMSQNERLPKRRARFDRFPDLVKNFAPPTNECNFFNPAQSDLER